MPYEPPTVHRITIEQCIEIVESDEGMIRRELIQRMRNLASKLQAEAANLASDTEYTPNSLGVIQGAGSEIDRLCGERARMVDFLHLLKKSGKP